MSGGWYARWCADDHPRFRLIPAHEAVEIGLCAASKGHAVERLMSRRRSPVVADLHRRRFHRRSGHGCRARFGGQGLRVSEFFGGDPAKVRAWLKRGVERLDGRPAPSPAAESRHVSTLDLGVVGNCAIASLIDRNGRHVWHGLGRLDGDPVFNALLGGNDPRAASWMSSCAGAKATATLPAQHRHPRDHRSKVRAAPLRILDFAPRFRRFGRMFRPPCWSAGWSRWPAGRGSPCGSGRPSTTAPAGRSHRRQQSCALLRRHLGPATDDRRLDQLLLHETEFSSTGRSP